jgi:hypothetical protein
MTSSFLRSLQRDTTEILILQLADTVFSSSSRWAKMARRSEMNSLQSKFAWLTALDKQYSLGEITLPVISENVSAEEILFLLHSKIGLAQLLEDLNRRIIEDFGGTIMVASKVGEGTTVQLTLPKPIGNGTQNQVSRKLSDADDSCC